MTQNSNEPRESLAPGVRESSRGGDGFTVPHATEIPRGPQTDVVASWWAGAETAWAMSDFPKYGSPEWEALADDDPRKLAGMLSAAEKWHQATGGDSPWASD